MSIPARSPGAAGLDLQSAATVCELFRQAADACRRSTLRRGSSIHLPRRGRLVMTGDLHDHLPNLERILRLAEVDQSPDNHVVLHEIVHGPGKINGRDLSVRTLARVASLKAAYPEQVHLLLANHELAQFSGQAILKNGHSSVEAFEDGLEFIYGQDCGSVEDAMNDLVASMPLAVRCANGVFCSHSLPNHRKLPAFDLGVVDRELEPADYLAGGAAYDMVWGRDHPQALADKLAATWNARLFVLGHQPAEMGYEVHGASILILASDHEHGVGLPIELAGEPDMNQLIEAIVPLAAV